MSTALARRRPIAGVALSLLLAAGALGVGAPAAGAAPKGGVSRSAGQLKPVAAPTSDPLAVLTGLLARLVPPMTPTSPGLSPSSSSTVTASTVRVTGAACGLRLAGSGFSPAPDTIVTNAHVVAGTTSTSVLRPDGTTLAAQVQVFDPKRDLAVLAVPGLGEPSLPVGSAVVGESDTIFGHPRGQVPVDAIPATVVRRVTADIGDIYDRPGATREILVLAATLQPGDSGAPLVNSAGNVVGVAFASSNLRPSVSFAVAGEELAPVLAQPRRGLVDTGPCLED